MSERADFFCRVGFERAAGQQENKNRKTVVIRSFQIFVWPLAASRNVLRVEKKPATARPPRGHASSLSRIIERGRYKHAKWVCLKKNLRNTYRYLPRKKGHQNYVRILCEFRVQAGQLQPQRKIRSNERETDGFK